MSKRTGECFFIVIVNVGDKFFDKLHCIELTDLTSNVVTVRRIDRFFFGNYIAVAVFGNFTVCIQNNKIFGNRAVKIIVYAHLFNTLVIGNKVIHKVSEVVLSVFAGPAYGSIVRVENFIAKREEFFVRCGQSVVGSSLYAVGTVCFLGVFVTADNRTVGLIRREIIPLLVKKVLVVDYSVVAEVRR